jgi:hypothetical protein
MNTILFQDIDGCIRPSGNFLQQINGEVEPKDGHTHVTVLHPVPGNVKVLINFGEPKEHPADHIWKDTFLIPNHIIDFMKSAHKMFECRWASWWGPNSSTALCEALGIEPWDNSAHPQAFATHDHIDDYKYEFVRANYSNRPFVWVDDCEILDRHKKWAASLDTPSLLITPDHKIGLTPEHIEQMHTFAKDNN